MRMIAAVLACIFAMPTIAAEVPLPPRETPVDAIEPVLDITVTAAFAQLSDRRTAAQQAAWFDSVKGKHIRWKMKVAQVDKGWYAYTVSAALSAGTLHCDLPLEDESVLKINKGQTVTCDGEISGYSKILGTLLVVTNATVQP